MRAVSVQHYENFPVASILCPPELRQPITAIYRFARTADDIADEGDEPEAMRRTVLTRYRHALAGAVRGQPQAQAWPEVFIPLSEAIRTRQLPAPLLDDLLDAFMQDTGNPRYTDRAALLEYCRRSANPVGRLVLHLAGIDEPSALRQSDAICTALQLINFWQDTSIDLPRGRCYLPESDARRHGLSLDRLIQHSGDGAPDCPASQAMLGELCRWAETLMREGAPLALRVPGRLGWELRLVVQGGLRVLDRMGQRHYRTLRWRPKLGAADLPILAWRALAMGLRQAAPRPAWP